MTRLKATVTHLLCSAAVGAIVFTMLWTVWYPAPYFAAAGGAGLFLLLIGVDVVAGPALTAVVFNPVKKSLKMDMAIIIAMQVAVLLYGLHTMWQARPAYILAGVDRFFLVQASDLDDADIRNAKLEQFATVPVSGPVLAGVIPPEKGTEQLEAIEMAARGRDVQYFPKYYVPYEGERLRLARLGHSLVSLKPALTPQLESRVLKAVGADSLDSTKAVWFPLDSRQGSFTLLLSTSDATPLDVLPVSPWDIIDTPDARSVKLDSQPVATGVHVSPAPDTTPAHSAEPEPGEPEEK